MAITNFPNGVTSFGTPMIGGGLPLASSAGNYLFVDSVNGSTGGTGEFGASFATLAGAVNAARANDIIAIAPGHAETITAAGGIAINKAGLTIIGSGSGATRPTFSFGTATTATITVTAANVTVQNCRFVSTFADVATAFNVTASGFSAIGNFFGDSAIDLNLISAIKCTSTTDGNANNFTALSNFFTSQDAATLAFVTFAADVLNVQIDDNVIVSEGTGLATIFTCATGKDIRMLICQRNKLSSKATAGNLAWSNDTASPNNSGIITNNMIGHADVTGQHVLGLVGGCRFFGNQSVSTDALSGFVLPAIDVDL